MLVSIWTKINNDKRRKEVAIYREGGNAFMSNTNVWGEPVFSAMVAGWFCEKSGWIGKVEDVKLVLFIKNRTSTGNHFEEEGFNPDELWNKRISFGLIHLGPDTSWLSALDQMSVISL